MTCTGSLAFGGAADDSAESAVYVGKVARTPRFYQSHPIFPYGGVNFCCPVSVSDSLVYFGTHGFPNLLPPRILDPIEAQVAIIDRLASAGYMNTDPHGGTDAIKACLGVQHFVEARGYVCQMLEYRGWHHLPSAADPYAAGGLASLQWIKRMSADPNGTVWINVGWYVHGTAPVEWKRVGGHWVAVVGYGTDGRQTNENILLIDNPAIPYDTEAAAASDNPDPQELAQEAMYVEAAVEGRLTGDCFGLPRAAAGTYRVWGPGIKIPSYYDAAFLEGAIAFKIMAPQVHAYRSLHP